MTHRMGEIFANPVFDKVCYIEYVKNYYICQSRLNKVEVTKKTNLTMKEANNPIKNEHNISTTFPPKKIRE